MKNLLLILALLFSFSFVNAQQDFQQTKGEKIQALKIAFITQKLDLTTDEAQRFWPVYNRYESEIRQVMSANSGDAIDNEEKVLNIKKRYRQEFIKTIGQPKANTLFNSEREFRNALMRRLKNGQGKRPMKFRR